MTTIPIGNEDRPEMYPFRCSEWNTSVPIAIGRIGIGRTARIERSRLDPPVAGSSDATGNERDSR